MPDSADKTAALMQPYQKGIDGRKPVKMQTGANK